MKHILLLNHFIIYQASYDIALEQAREMEPQVNKITLPIIE